MTDARKLIEELRNLREPYSYSPSLGERAAAALEASEEARADADRLTCVRVSDDDVALIRRYMGGANVDLEVFVHNAIDLYVNGE